MTGHAGAPLCTTVAKAPDNRHDSFTPQHLANAAWALATEELADGVLLPVSAKATEGVDNDKIPQPMASTAWAFATVSQAAASPITTLAKAVGAVAPHSCPTHVAIPTRISPVKSPSPPLLWESQILCWLLFADHEA